MMMMIGKISTPHVQYKNSEDTSAKTYISFIMSLIKLKLTPKEKLKIAEKVYKDFQKKQQEERMKKEKEEKLKNDQHVTKNKPYYLRF